MKRLILVRHGKSSWNHDVTDAQRPLKKRAYADAEKVVGAFLAGSSSPEVLWTSHAKRALESARTFQGRLGLEEEDFFIKEELYTFDDRQLLRAIKSCDDTVNVLMVFGHNPAITEVANSLGNEIFDNVPTTGLVAIDFHVESWREIKHGKTLFSLFPKNL